MRIGVVPYLDRNGGGIYQYSLAVLRALADWKTDDEILLISTNSENTFSPPVDIDWEIKYLESEAAKSRAVDGLRKIIGEGPHREAWRLLRKKIGQNRDESHKPMDLDAVRFRPQLKQQFQRWKLDLALYTWPTSTSFEAGIPFIMAIHDLQHRLQPEFGKVESIASETPPVTRRCSSPIPMLAEKTYFNATDHMARHLIESKYCHSYPRPTWPPM
jgi:hypothetical protein